MVGRVRVVVVGVVLVAASCSSSGGTATETTTTTVAGGSTVETTTTTGAPDETTDAPPRVLPADCLLLTTGDIEEATGVTFSEGTVNESLSDEVKIACDWASTELSSFSFVQVLIADYPYDETKAGTESVYTVTDISIPGANRAYATDDGSIIGMEVGGLYVQVSYITGDEVDVLAITTDLATRAVAAM
jgi:hypothetical protein